MFHKNPFQVRRSWVESRDERQNISGCQFLFYFVVPRFVMRILLRLEYFRRVL